jgi:hypothetical protein
LLAADGSLLSKEIASGGLHRKGEVMQLLTKAPKAPKFVTRLAIAAVMALSLAVVASPAAKALPVNIGGYVAGSGYCWDSTRILATPPGMLPAANAPVSYVGGGQQVGFRAILQRWNGSQWYDISTGPLLTRFAGYTILGDETWFNNSTRTNVQGNTMFSLNGTTGYLRVTYKMFWYINGAVSGQIATLAYGHFDNRADKVNVAGWSTYDWCRY